MGGHDERGSEREVKRVERSKHFVLMEPRRRQFSQVSDGLFTPFGGLVGGIPWGNPPLQSQRGGGREREWSVKQAAPSPEMAAETATRPCKSEEGHMMCDGQRSQYGFALTTRTVWCLCFPELPLWNVPTGVRFSCLLESVSPHQKAFLPLIVMERPMSALSCLLGLTG